MRSRVVLVTRLGSSLGLSGQHDGLIVADVRHPDAVETTIAGVHRGGELPVVTCALEDYEEVRTLVSYASVRYPGLRTCIEPLPGGPLAVGVLSSLVDDIDDADDGLAWQLNAIDLLRAQAWSATWLPSVAKSHHPNPSLWHHAMSWLPGSGFLAVHHPTPRIVPARKAPISGVDPLPETALLHSRPTQDTWVVDAVRQALQPQSTSEMSAVRDQVDAHGTERAVELVAIPLAYHSDSRPVDVVDCLGCGLRHARPSCPVCGMAVAPPLDDETPAPVREVDPETTVPAPSGSPAPEGDRE